jgi:hypothetical protein
VPEFDLSFPRQQKPEVFDDTGSNTGENGAF